MVQAGGNGVADTCVWNAASTPPIGPRPIRIAANGLPTSRGPAKQLAADIGVWSIVSDVDPQNLTAADIGRRFERQNLSGKNWDVEIESRPRRGGRRSGDCRC
jgi:hypothetical protein